MSPKRKDLELEQQEVQQELGGEEQLGVQQSGEVGGVVGDGISVAMELDVRGILLNLRDKYFICLGRMPEWRYVYGILSVGVFGFVERGDIGDVGALRLLLLELDKLVDSGNKYYFEVLLLYYKEVRDILYDYLSKLG